MKGNRLNVVWPPECKNKKALEDSEIGLVLNHAKSKRIKGENFRAFVCRHVCMCFASCFIPLLHTGKVSQTILKQLALTCNDA